MQLLTLLDWILLTHTTYNTNTYTIYYLQYNTHICDTNNTNNIIRLLALLTILVGGGVCLSQETTPHHDSVCVWVAAPAVDVQTKSRLPGPVPSLVGESRASQALRAGNLSSAVCDLSSLFSPFLSIPCSPGRRTSRFFSSHCGPQPLYLTVCWINDPCSHVSFTCL